MLRCLVMAWLVESCVAVLPSRSFYLAADERSETAIAVLTRGYEDLAHYDQFIARGQALAAMPWAQKVDHLIYHQGDITPSQQEHLRLATKLRMEFINITQAFNEGWQRTYKENPNATWVEKCPSKSGNHFGFSYRTVSDWWSRQFLSDPTLLKYKYMLRIDEDATVTESEEAKQWTLPNGSTHYASRWNTECNDHGGDAVAVTRGLNELLFGAGEHVVFCSPFTEVSWVNLEWARSSLELTRMMADVDLSGCVYANRWGDLPLWGAFLNKLQEPMVELELPYKVNNPKARHLHDDQEVGGELQVGSYRWYSDWSGRLMQRGRQLQR